jgi:hypothetical protein
VHSTCLLDQSSLDFQAILVQDRPESGLTKDSYIAAVLDGFDRFGASVPQPSMKVCPKALMDVCPVS